MLGQTLVTLLADGQFQSGTALGQKTGRTRTAVWKAIKSLQQGGMSIYSVRGKGYRLAEPIELLCRDTIFSALDALQKKLTEPNSSSCCPSSERFLSTNQRVPEMRAGDQMRLTTIEPTRLPCLEVFHDIKSTNAYLLGLARCGEDVAYACLAEQQQAGRGRRGRDWVSPFGGNLYLSLLWHFNTGATGLGGLSLAVAVAVLRALRTVGLNNVRVKWPNDIIVNGRKLAGILLEVAGETSGPCAVVMGVGLNVRTPKSEMMTVEQPWTDLESELGTTVARNMLAAQLIHELMNVAREFELNGLQPFLTEWMAHDVYADCEVVLHMPQGEVRGTARGVDEDGALLLMSGGELRRFHSGEVSLRVADTAGKGA